MASNASLYSPLDDVKDEIRVLDLEPGEDHDTISCHLRTVSLGEAPEYDALSYAWGDPKATSLILVNGKPFQATVSLSAFLGALRDGTRTLTLWADAICINQSDNDERTVHVQRMDKIYTQSSLTRIWLGEFGDGWQAELPKDLQTFESAMQVDPNQLIQRLQRCDAELGTVHLSPPPRLEPSGTVLDGLNVAKIIASGVHIYEMPILTLTVNEEVKTAYPDPDWYSSFAIFSWIITRPWWYRAWTIQEAVLPMADPVLHVGRKTMPLDAFLAASRQVNKHFICCSFMLGSWACGSNMTRASLWQVSLLSNLRSGNRLDFRMMLLMSLMRQTTDRRDHLFGLVGLLDKERLPFTVDYDRSYEIVCCQAARLTQRVCPGTIWPSRAVGINGDGIPTWAMRLTTQDLFAGDQFTMPAKAGGDGSPEQEQDYEGLTSLELELIVRVVHISSVVSALPPADPKDGPLDVNEVREVIERWLEQTSCVNDTARQQKFFTAILEEGVPFNVKTKLTPSDSKVASQTAIDDMLHWWTRFAVLLKIMNEDPESFLAKHKHEYLTMAGQSSGSRLFAACKHVAFLVAECGDFGISRPGVNVGDEIFVVQGLPYPLVLRPEKNDSEDGKRRFKLVGPCHLNGWMQGKAVHDKTVWEKVLLV